MSPPRARVRPPWLRVLIAVGTVILGVVGVAAFAVGAAVGLARTSWGAERIRRLALPRLNAALAGHLDVARWRFGGDRVVFDGLAVDDPEGRPVVRVARLELVFSPSALLRGRVHLREVIVDGADLGLHRDARGFNLARALAARDSGRRPGTAARAPVSAADRRRGGPAFLRDVLLDDLTVRDVRVDFRDGDPHAAPALGHVHVEGLGARASGRYLPRGTDAGWRAHLDVHGNGTAPLALPLALSLAAEGTLGGDSGDAPDRGASAAPGLDARASVDLSYGPNGVHASGHLVYEAAAAGAAVGTEAARARTRGQFRIDRVDVAPALIRLFAPGSPLVATVGLKGEGTWTWDGQTGAGAAAVRIDAGGATADVRGSLSLAPGRPALDGLSVRARGIDLARLLAEGPSSSLALDLEAQASGPDLASLRGALTLAVPRGRLGGHELGPVRLRADADHGNYKVLDLLAVLPGARLSGAGETTAHRMAFRAALDLRDLGAMVGSITAGRRAGSPRAAGHGRIEVAIDGNPRAPSLSVHGRLSRLVWQAMQIPAVELEAAVPDLRAPLASSLHARVPELQWQTSGGARVFREILVSIQARGPVPGHEIEGRLSLAAPEPLQMDFAGGWAPGRIGTALSVRRFHLGWREARWTLATPASIALEAGTVRVSDVDLRASDGAQRIRGDVEETARSLRADVRVTAFDLTQLPHTLLPPKLKLAGRVDAAVQITGPSARPRVVARLALAGGRVGALEDLELSAEARLDGSSEVRVVSGRLEAHALGADVTGRFDLPLAWPPPPPARFRAHLSVANLDLQRLLVRLRRTPAAAAAMSPSPIVVVGAPRPPDVDVRGQASLELDLEGQGRPELSLRADVRRLAIDGTTIGDVSVTVDGAGRSPRAPLSARLEVRTSASAGASVQAAEPAVVAVRTALTLAELMRRAPKPGELLERVLAAPLHIDAHADGVALAPLAVLAGYPRKVGGRAAFQLLLDGPPRQSRGKLSLRLAGLTTGRFPPTDGALDVTLGERRIGVIARVTRRSATLFAVTGGMDAPLARLWDTGRLLDTPIELHAQLGPLDLQRAGLPPASDRQPPRVLGGRVSATLDVTGTPRAPRLAARADVANIRLDKTLVGKGQVALAYRDRQATADVHLISANGGALHLMASTQADLGYPAVTRGLDPRRLALTATLRAQGFDVAGLSGATPGLRAVSGQIFADAQVTGTTADPRPSGRIEWKAGGLTITGMGEYKQIHLLVHGDRDHLLLDELRASSGGGHARVTGEGTHRAQGGYDGGYDTKASVNLNDFPLYVEGQALASLSLKAGTEAQLSPSRARVKVAIESARLALSDGKRKQLQKLGRPADVVLVDGGQPLNPAQAKKLAVVQAALAKAAAASSGAPAPSAPPDTNAKPAGVVVRIEAERNLWVSGKDANLELRLEPGFRVEMTDTTRVFGQVVVKRGRVDVAGRRFDVKPDSVIRFSGAPDAPELDVSATHKNEKENITVVVTVKGTPGHIQIGISSPERPDLTETQLYTLVITGRLDLGGGGAGSTTPADRAATLVGGLLASQLQKSLAKKLPFDVLTIEAGNGVGSARLEAGTYLTSNLYVGYVGRLGADPALLQNRNAAHLEYELTSRWSFQGEYGDAKTGSADLMWTKRY